LVNCLLSECITFIKMKPSAITITDLTVSIWELFQPQIHWNVTRICLKLSSFGIITLYCKSANIQGGKV
jgi:hypothetical protein